MKKFLIIAIALGAIVSQAASIDWTVTSSRNTFLWDTTGTKYSGTAYLVLASDVLTLKTYADAKTLSESAFDEVELTGGAYKIANRTATSDALVRDTEYHLQVMFLDEVNKKYALSDVHSQFAYKLVDDEALGMSFVYDELGIAKTAAESTTVWKPVPEPATGALALAGLALLFRRKRA